MSRLFLALSVLLLIGCAEKDNTKPVVRHLSLSQKSYDWPGPLQVSVAAKDDEELVQVRLFISAAFSKTLPWRYTFVENVDGASFQNSYSITFPDSALAGYYSVSFGAVDANGNISADSIRYFHLRRSGIEPVFTDLQFQPPATDGIIPAGPGDTVIMSGTALSPTDLDMISFNLQDRLHFTAQNLFSISLQDTICNTYSFADTVVLDSALADPEYFLVGRATDSIGNQRRISFLLQTP